MGTGTICEMKFDPPFNILGWLVDRFWTCFGRKWECFPIANEAFRKIFLMGGAVFHDFTEKKRPVLWKTGERQNRYCPPKSSVINSVCLSPLLEWRSSLTISKCLYFVTYVAF